MWEGKSIGKSKIFFFIVIINFSSILVLVYYFLIKRIELFMLGDLRNFKNMRLFFFCFNRFLSLELFFRIFEIRYVIVGSL